MYHAQPRATGKRQAALAALVLGAVTLGSGWTGWAWWNSQGPFKPRTTWREPQRADAMEGVEYITPVVTYGPFVNFYRTRRWGQELTGVPPGDDPYPLAPFLKDDTTISGARVLDPAAQEVVREQARIKQDLTDVSTAAILAAGFRLPPYSTTARTTVSQSSRAEITTHIKTYRKKGDVLFQVETSVHRYVRGPFRKPVLFRLAVDTSTSPVYVAAEQEALRAIKEAVRNNARSVLGSSRTVAVLPADARYDLSPDPNYVRPEDRVPSVE